MAIRYNFGKLMEDTEGVSAEQAAEIFDLFFKDCKGNRHMMDILKETEGIGDNGEINLRDKEQFDKQMDKFKRAMSNVMAVLDKSDKKPEHFDEVQKERKKQNSLIAGFRTVAMSEVNNNKPQNGMKEQEVKKVKKIKKVKKVKKAQKIQKITIETFQSKILPNFIARLKNCKSIFRGSSSAFEDILETAKNMQKGFEKRGYNNITDYEMYLTTKLCADALVHKMTKYLDDRKNIGGKLPDNTTDYTGKRYWTMFNLREELTNYVDASKNRVDALYEKMVKPEEKTNDRTVEIKPSGKNIKPSDIDFLNAAFKNVVDNRNKNTGNVNNIEADGQEAKNEWKKPAAKKVEKKGLSVKEEFEIAECVSELVKKPLWKSKFNLDAYGCVSELSDEEYYALEAKMKHNKLTYEKADKFIRDFRVNKNGMEDVQPGFQV